MTDERVNHPKHYNSHPSGVECIDVIEHLLGNVHSAVKYLWRRDHKDDRIEDLKKARWYVQRELQRDLPLYSSRSSYIYELTERFAASEPNKNIANAVLLLVSASVGLVDRKHALTSAAEFITRELEAQS